ADIRKRLAAPLLVFILGMAISLVAARCGLSFARGRRRRHGGRAAPLLRRQDHVEERALLPRLRLDRADLAHLLADAGQDAVADVAMHVLAAAEDDRGLDLLPLAEEADDVVALELVVVLVGLGAELDLLDLDDPLLLLGLLGLLVELVPVLAVVQDAADRRTRVGRDFDEVQALHLRLAQRLVRRHDPQLAAVRPDDADLPGADLVVDPQLLLDGLSLPPPSTRGRVRRATGRRPAPPAWQASGRGSPRGAPGPGRPRAGCAPTRCAPPPRGPRPPA